MKIVSSNEWTRLVAEDEEMSDLRPTFAGQMGRSYTDFAGAAGVEATIPGRNVDEAWSRDGAQ